MLTGRVMDAAEALSHGVVSRVVPAADLDDTVLEMATAIAAQPRMAVKLARATIAGLGHEQVLRTLDTELLAQTAVMASPEYQRMRDARLAGTRAGEREQA